MTPGYLRLHVAGRPSHTPTGPFADLRKAQVASRDPYAIIFRAGVEAGAMAAAKDLIDYYREVGTAEPPAASAPPAQPAGPRYRVTIHSFGNASPARITRVLNEFFPDRFPRREAPPDPPIVVEAAYSWAEGLRQDLESAGARVEMMRIV